jgi:mRNA-degrading endonuclease toxin of MazEF toxin-antitoxin module
LLRLIRPREIWLVSLEDRLGHEQIGPHPALVLAIHKETQLYIIVPLTSNTDATKLPWTYSVPCSRKNGLNYDSWALIFQTTCCDYDRFTQKLGTIETEHYDQIARLIKGHMNL